MQKSRDFTDLCCQVQQRRRAGSLDGVIYVTYVEYRQSYREERKREREEEGGGGAERTRRLLENERSKYGTGTYVYISRRRSAGGATGASKNVLRTLDITGSNVTRSRREPRVCLSRSGEERRGAKAARRGRRRWRMVPRTTRYRDY